MRRVLFAMMLFGCGSSTRDDLVPDGSSYTPPDGSGSAGTCQAMPVVGPATGAIIASPYDQHYTVYDLGPVPGVPNPLGGSAIAASDPNTLLVAGGSETASGAIYKITLARDACGHITGFVGTAQLFAPAPYVDANLVFKRSNLLVYTQWPEFKLSQVPENSFASQRDTDLRTIGMTTAGDSGPGGAGTVPPGLASAGELRLATWPAGRWYHVATAVDGNLDAVNGVTQITTLPNNPGGFAYVPAGSPGFTQQALIAAEWSDHDPNQDRVAVYDVDAQGDPIVATRREFFSTFPRPWGAYFEPVSGDYLFLSRGTGNDHVYVVYGFVPPPPIT